MTSQVFIDFLDSLAGLPDEDETMDGSGGDETMDGSGGEGNINEETITDPDGDTLLGTFARDRYIGGEGADCLTGSLNQDTLYGGDDRDTLEGENGADVLFGNLQGDLISGGQEDDSLYGGKNSDILLGDEDEDLMFGNIGGDSMLGGTENDCLYGGQDNDVVSGNEGDDFLSGDTGIDTLIGGDGEDSFALSSNTGGNSDFFADIILDYIPDEDQIVLVGGLQESDLDFQETIFGDEAAVLILTDDPDDPQFLTFVLGVTENDLDIVLI